MNVPHCPPTLSFRIFQFGEHGKYLLNISSSSKDKGFGGNCDVTTLQLPINSSLPVLYSFVTFLSLFLVYYGGTLIRRRVLTSWVPGAVQDSSGLSPSPDLPPSSATRKHRLRSLDAFRGLSIVVMIFVNYGGGLYWFFTHSPWNGLTVADLVFPWFMFIMGTSMALSFESTAKRKVPLKQTYYLILRRSLILYLLGIFIVNHNFDWRVFRFCGVLQRFAVAYFVVAALRAQTVVSADEIRLKQSEAEGWRSRWLADVEAYWVEWLIMLLLVAVQLMFTFLLPVPGCPTGYLGPGGLAENGLFSNCTGGAAALMDKAVFGAKHLYAWPTCKRLYNTQEPFDPEGVLGNLSSIFIVFLGLQAGQVLLVYEGVRARLVRWGAWAAVYGLIAGVLCGFSKNEGWIPVNKNLWSLSYVLSMACTANALLMMFYYVMDVKDWWRGAPLYFVGMNSILLFVGHEVFGDYMPFNWTPIPPSHAAQLAVDLWGTSLWVLIAYYLHRHQFYLSI